MSCARPATCSPPPRGHAYRNPVRIWDLGEGFTMIVGPNAAAVFLEVGYIEGDTAVVIVHAMRAREKFLR